MRLALAAVTRVFPQPGDQWEKLRAELAPEPIVKFGQATWPANGDWPEALFYAQDNSGSQIHICRFDDNPRFARETAAARRWCIETLSPHVRQVSAKLAVEQGEYRAIINREAEAIILGGVAQTSRKELYIWLPLAVRMMRLYEAVNTETLSALSPQYWPEGEVAATVNIIVHEV